MSSPRSAKMQSFISLAVLGTVLIGLYFTTFVSYLLFHALAEGFSIVVAVSVFLIAWNSRRYINNPYLLFIGIAYLFIACIDLLHTLAYKGMPIFTGSEYFANQLWIGGRYMESLTLILAFVFLRRGMNVRLGWVFSAYTLVTGLLVASVLYWRVFPECFIEGQGLTPFKIISEYIICGLLGLAIALLRINRRHFERKIYLLLFGSMICTIISELAFTFYVSNYGFSNLVGHYFKIFSFLMIYRAIIKTGIEKPYDLVFHDLNRANQNLTEEVRFRIQVQKEKEKLILDLQNALEEIKTLQGILPICMHCKKIRDDQGSWSQLEAYIREHSDADFSHGICPECLREHYPELAETD